VFVFCQYFLCSPYRVYLSGALDSGKYLVGAEDTMMILIMTLLIKTLLIMAIFITLNMHGITYNNITYNLFLIINDFTYNDK
jgi:hypothetical protein